MPRDGSINLPAGAAVPAAPMDIGEVANPPFAIRPDPQSIFLKRSERFATLAKGHEIEGYLRFLADLCRAQHSVQSELAPARLPSPEKLATAHEHMMPPISFSRLEPDEIANQTLLGIARKLSTGTLTQASKSAVDNVIAASDDARVAMMRAILVDEVPDTAIAEHILAAAALQVHFARLASGLDVDALKPIAPGACPACGSAPVSSMLVNWEGMYGSRFCTCSLCSTNWHTARIKCLACGGERGIAYHSIEGGSSVILGETCEGCHSYVKIFHQHKDAALDAVADDVASLALDIVLGKEGWVRASANPFLLGY